jgi:hypothetical protein
MKRLLLKVDAVFEVPGRGLAVLPVLEDEDFKQVHSPIEVFLSLPSGENLICRAIISPIFGSPNKGKVRYQTLLQNCDVEKIIVGTNIYYEA